MHLVKTKFKGPSGKTYTSVMLRESYREGGKVKKRTVASLSKCSPEEIAAIEWALKHKDCLTPLASNPQVRIAEGRSLGGVWVVLEMAKRLGIADALGKSQQGLMALWQVIARVLEQGSRLSAVRLGSTYAIADAIGLKEGFTEDHLYANLRWLADSQATIEDKLFHHTTRHEPPCLFLYDVTSSYLEGENNALADWGYNRDKKRGKQQIVIGMLALESGQPVAVEVFKGNTQDTSTFKSQVEKVTARFGCTNVVMVGDRGMIKSGQIATLQEHGLHYITALTKAQIKTLLTNGTLQMVLFDENITEVIDGKVRYIIRRNPLRAHEIAQTRSSKRASIERYLEVLNQYLDQHKKASVDVALKKAHARVAKLNMDKWLTVSATDRVLTAVVDETVLTETGRMDGCYALKTDLCAKQVTAQLVHDRYKDLALVETAFRTVKSDLDIRPLFVRSEASTRGHVLVVMLAYVIMRALDQAWQSEYLTVSEGLHSLSTLTLQTVTVGEGKSFQSVPEPRETNRKLLDALLIRLPTVLPKSKAIVVTRRPRRKINTTL